MSAVVGVGEGDGEGEEATSLEEEDVVEEDEEDGDEDELGVAARLLAAASVSCVGTEVVLPANRNEISISPLTSCPPSPSKAAIVRVV